MTIDSHNTGDEVLMGRLQNGDLAALGDLYLRHGALVKSAVRRYAADICETEIDDLVHETFLQLKRTAPFYRESGTFRAWLFGISVQIAKNRYKKGAVHAALLKAHAHEPIGMSTGSTGCPEVTAVARDLVVKALEGLSENQLEALVLFEVEGFSAAEIGQILSVSENVIWTRLHRARKAVLKRIGKIERNIAPNPRSTVEALP